MPSPESPSGPACDPRAVVACPSLTVILSCLNEGIPNARSDTAGRSVVRLVCGSMRRAGAATACSRAAEWSPVSEVVVLACGADRFLRSGEEISAFQLSSAPFHITEKEPGFGRSSTDRFTRLFFTVSRGTPFTNIELVGEVVEECYVHLSEGFPLTPSFFSCSPLLTPSLLSRATGALLPFLCCSRTRSCSATRARAYLRAMQVQNEEGVFTAVPFLVRA